jgi:hypothetical protein
VKQVFYNSGFAGTGRGREDNDLTLHAGLGGFLNDVFDGGDQTRPAHLFFLHSSSESFSAFSGAYGLRSRKHSLPGDCKNIVVLQV